MKIILNATETRFRNLDQLNFKPATLEILYEPGLEVPFTIGLFITADHRDMEFDDSCVVRVKAAWSTPEEFAQWVGQLVSFAALLGLTDTDDQE